MWGKKKKVEEKKQEEEVEDLPPLSAVSEDSQPKKQPEPAPKPIDPQVKAELDAMVKDFMTRYSGIVTLGEVAQNNTRALELNLMFAIYGELRRLREISEQE